MSSSLAMCVIIRDEAPYIEEWLAFHLLQGATNILVYDNGSTDGTLQLLAKAAAAAPITVMDWSDQPGHFDTVQRAVYADGTVRLTASVNFVAFVDADEFLHAGEGQTVVEALGDFDQEVSAIAVNQRVFGSSGLVEHEPGLVTSRFIRCTEPAYVENRWFKTIARHKQIVKFSSVHSVVAGSGRYVMNDGDDLTRDTDHPGLATRVGEGRLTVNHYMLRSLEEYHRKQRRWQSRPEMHGRYSMGYFHGREPVANAVIDDRLVPLSEQIEHLMFHLRDPAPPVKVDTIATVEPTSSPETVSTSFKNGIKEPQIPPSRLLTRMLRRLRALFVRES